MFLLLKKDVIMKYNSQITTNAWLKFYEILSYMPKLISATSESKKLNVFFNAELPGGFISSANHFIKTKTNTTMDWRASSLIGDDDSLGDVYGLYASYKNNWLMGKNTHNGDLTNPDVLVAIEKQINTAWPTGVRLYTADGGIGVNEDYNKQEEINAKLDLGQVLSGFMTLAEGGSSVTKHYMFTYPNSISLIAIMSHLFDDLFITKPVTSRPVNSEIYIIGVGFIKSRFTKELRNMLLDSLKKFDFNTPLIPLETIPDDTLETIFTAARNIHEITQTSSINNIIGMYYTYSMNEIYNQMKPLYKLAIESYYKANPIRKLRFDEQLKIPMKSVVM